MRYWITALLATAALTVGLFVALDLLPPRQITMAAGNPGTAYHALALEYRRVLAEDGITLEILETSGSVDNARALEAGAHLALLQGGVAAPAGTAPLAAVMLEPMFVLHRAGLEAGDPGTWEALRIAAGADGSGTRAAVRAVMAALGDPVADGDLLSLGTLEAAEALVAGRIDAAIFVAPVTAPYLVDLLPDPNLDLARLRDLAAIAARLDFVEVVEIPAAGIDYLRRLPPETVQLPAMVGRLVAAGDLHPALVDRLVAAARRIHARPDLVTPEGRFPSAEGLGSMLNPKAVQLLRDGPGPLDGALPFWAVAQINRVLVLLLPVLFLLVPLMRALPALYAWGMNARIWRHYDEVMAIDTAGETAADPQAIEALLARLSELDAAVRRVRVARRFRHKAYGLRMHIDLVRARLLARLPEEDRGGRR
ncbi:MAG: TAXI family TRAP transporter solute-binding subunit [Alkalilacustris sp.]